MRVLLIDQFGELGGGQRCLMEAAAGFAARGWELHAAIPTDGPLARALLPFSKSVVRLVCGPFTPARKNLGDAFRLAAQLPRQISTISAIVKREGIDVLYANGPRVLPAAALARGTRPLVYHAHWAVPQRPVASIVANTLRTSSATVLASSRFVARSFGQSIQEDRIGVIYNGVAGFGAAPRPRSRYEHIAVIGRISPEKGQLEFVRAARLAARSAFGLRFTICGAPMFGDPGYFHAVRAEAAEAGVALPGWNDAMGTFLAGIDLLVVPSARIDNIPRVILEAFSAGVPVLAFASGGIGELIEHGETGLLVENQTPERLAEAMLRAVEDPARLNAIAQGAHARWQARYTLGRFQAEVSGALEEAVRRQRTPVQSAGASARA
jgi:glycosyltransferase involved in cell wall biosynthesis